MMLDVYEGKAVVGLCRNLIGSCRANVKDGWVAAFGLPYNCSRWAFGVLWWKQTGYSARRGVPQAFLSRFISWGVLENIAETPRKRPTAITLSKIVPETSGWTQKTRNGVLYNLCAKSGAKLFFRRSYGDLWVFDLAAQPC